MQQIKIAILVVIAGVVYAGYDFYVFSDEEVSKMQVELRGLDTSIKRQQTRLAELKRFKQNIENIKQELKELNIQFKTALEQLPREFDLSKLLRQLTLLAKNSGVNLVNFKPSTASPSAGGTFYSSVGISFDVLGPYVQCLLYFDQITRLKRIINIENIDIRKQQIARRRRGETEDSDMVLAKTKIVTFRFSE